MNGFLGAAKVTCWKTQRGRGRKAPPILN